MFFCQDEREKIKTELPDLNAKEVTSELGRRWKQLSDEKKATYIERQNKDRLRYSTEKTLEKPVKKETQKVRKTAPVKKTKKQNTKPKKTVGFQNFCNEEKVRIKSENPEWSSAEINTELTEMWNELNEEDRQQYEEDAIEEENDIDLDD